MSYAPIEAARQIGIGVSTLRLWAKIYADHLSPSANRATTEHGTPAQRRFTDDDLIILARVKTLLNQGLRYEQVKAALSGDSTDRPPEAAQEPLQRVQQADSGPDALQYLATSLQAALQERERLIAALEGQIQDMRADHVRELTAKDQHIADLRAQLDKVQPAAPQARRSWWRRLLGE